MDTEADAEEIIRLLSVCNRPLVRRTLLDLLDSLRASMEQQRYQEVRGFQQPPRDSAFSGAASSALQWPPGDLGNVLAANDLAHQLRSGGSSVQQPAWSDWLASGAASSSGGGWGSRLPSAQDASSMLSSMSRAHQQGGRSLSLPYHPPQGSALNMPLQLQPANKAMSLPGLGLPDLSSLAISQTASGKASAAALQRLQLLQELGLDKGPSNEPSHLLATSSADLRVSGIRNLPLAPVLIPPSCDGGDGAGLLFSKLTTCSWEQSSTSVRVYVPLRGVQTSQIQASFEQSSVEVKILNLKGKNYLYSIPRTYRPIVPGASVAVASKTRKNVLITLQKLNSATLEDRHWKDLHWSPDSESGDT